MYPDGERLQRTAVSYKILVECYKFNIDKLRKKYLFFFVRKAIINIKTVPASEKVLVVLGSRWNVPVLHFS